MRNAQKLILSLTIVADIACALPQGAKKDEPILKEPPLDARTGDGEASQECSSPDVATLKEYLLKNALDAVRIGDGEKGLQFLDSNASIFKKCADVDQWRWWALRIEALCLTGKHETAWDDLYAARSKSADLAVLRQATSFCMDLYASQKVELAREQWEKDNSSTASD
jgi:hypothetical protein